ncbi:hypothetical protein I6A84_02080 [Frankia sp. CNm7]|uniref:Uncharacterized protein n=1 Tax=Frankia nepalensis TaxID=1836974 RepID=A0A937UPS4_9ACTN|nr:hypothetical protein [Frankia nepalensis]MBL7497338.1 hypothetical protein [Frankia nepalensis]MBL7509705.1 hypothetical protein [Frankia nepalensis]MBL7516947.1 hypothetical protein [Frankia nepalensis]MBL7629432.1 hypothetical protein [Frankia nepalensis]
MGTGDPYGGYSGQNQPPGDSGQGQQYPPADPYQGYPYPSPGQPQTPAPYPSPGQPQTPAPYQAPPPYQTPAPYETPAPYQAPTPYPSPGAPAGWQQQPAPWQQGYPPPGQQQPWPGQYQQPGGGPPSRPRPAWLVPVIVIASVLVLGAAIFGVVRLTDDDDDSTATFSRATPSVTALIPGGQAPPPSQPATVPSNPPTIPDAGSSIPEEYLGTWAGPHGDVPVILELRQGTVDDVVGTTTYEGYCVETLTLTSVDASSVHVFEKADPGDPCSDADITLTLNRDGTLTLRYDSYDPNDPRAWIEFRRVGQTTA